MSATSLPLHLKELEHRAAVLQLSLQGLRAAWAGNAVALVGLRRRLLQRREAQGASSRCPH